ncbi:MAG: hypothetical protein DRI86_15465 [Bacteroidetes bacterium]|nr:MAG: hypothetical protein DRI86_15465 [Bacteroidota bacterium]
MTSLVLVFFVLNLVTSCKKEEVKQLNRSVENTESSNEVDKPIAPWLVYLAAAVIIKVVVELAEGQYEMSSITHPDGTIITTAGCYGIGSCAIPGTINNNGGEGDGQPLSSEEIDFDFEVSQKIDGEYIKLDDGRIIFTIKPNSDGYNDFFYSDEISISKPYVIDNPVFISLMELESGNSIVVSGNYAVQTDSDGQKYIVVQ